MIYLLIFIVLIILFVILIEIRLHKTRFFIRYINSLIRPLYFCSIIVYICSLLSFLLSKQTFYLGIIILLPLSFIALLISLLFTFNFYTYNEKSITKHFIFIKKEYEYKDFIITNGANKITATSINNGKELFYFTSFQINVSNFLNSYSNFNKNREFTSYSNIIRANKTLLSVSLWFYLLGLMYLAIGISLTILYFNNFNIPIFMIILLFILILITLTFSTYCLLIYFYNYIEINGDKLVIHKLLKHPKTYESKNLQMIETFIMIKIYNQNDKLLFFFLKNFTQNYFIIYKLIEK